MLPPSRARILRGRMKPPRQTLSGSPARARRAETSSRLIRLGIIGLGFAWLYGVWSTATRSGERPAEDLFNRAVHALRAGEWSEAELFAEKAGVRGGTRLWPHRDFVLGAAAFARGQAAAIEAARPDGGPFAFERALGHARSALDAWRRAVAARDDDWPAARRNAERAARLIADLQQKKDAADAQRKARPGAPPQPPQQQDLDEKLDENQRRKRADRARRNERAIVERDW
jgi:hypothetical protein